jgi:hypothetical protein
MSPSIMSASPGNRIMCYRCGTIFDHNPQYARHCKCKGCGVSISIPDARRTFAANTNIGGLAAGSAAGRAPPTPIPHAVPVDAALPPICRDEKGQPLPKEKPSAPEKPHFVADDFSFIARRMKQLQAEKESRVAGSSDDEGFSF